MASDAWSPDCNATTSRRDASANSGSASNRALAYTRKDTDFR